MLDKPYMKFIFVLSPLTHEVKPDQVDCENKDMGKSYTIKEKVIYINFYTF